MVVRFILCAMFLSLAAISNAGMDVLDHHFNESFVSEWDAQFWNPSLSWRNKYVDGDPEKGLIMWWFISKPVPFTDGWHLLKLFMIIFIILSVVVWAKGRTWLKIGYVLCGGVIWNLSFETFYAKIFRKGKK